MDHRRELLHISFPAFPLKVKVQFYEKGYTTCNLALDISCYDIYIINSNFNYRNRSLLLKGLKGHSDKIESGEQRCPLPFHFLNKSKLKQRPI